jgi:hypothetical protein
MVLVLAAAGGLPADVVLLADRARMHGPQVRQFPLELPDAPLNL